MGLATALLAEERYPLLELSAVYWRGGQETYYGRRKGRLDREHASGTAVAAVAQDFHASVRLANVESVVIGPAQAALAAHTARRKQAAQVHRAVRLPALKHRLIELLTSRVPAAAVLAQLTEWFQANPVSVRPGRQVPRRAYSPARSYHYQRRMKKIVFGTCIPYFNGSAPRPSPPVKGEPFAALGPIEHVSLLVHFPGYRHKKQNWRTACPSFPPAPMPVPSAGGRG